MVAGRCRRSARDDVLLTIRTHLGQPRPVPITCSSQIHLVAACCVARSDWFRIRVAALLAVFVGVLIYAWHDIASRSRRTHYDKPLEVAIVLLEPSDRTAAFEPALVSMQRRVRALEDRLNGEFARYRPDGQARLSLSLYGPVVSGPPPSAPSTGSSWIQTFMDLARYSFDSWRYTRSVDLATALPSRAFDARIYVVLEPSRDPERSFVEGYSEKGGRVGIARVQLDETTVDLGLFVVAHELMHTLGADDKYGADGSALIPTGLGDPEQQPLFPQRMAEVMARNRVVEPGVETIPTSLDELSIGRWTAAEIGLLQAP